MVRRPGWAIVHHAAGLPLRLPRPDQDRRAGAGLRPEALPRQEHAGVLRSGEPVPARRRRRGDGAGGLRSRHALRPPRRDNRRHRHRRHDHDRGRHPPLPRARRTPASPNGPEAHTERMPGQSLDPLRAARPELRRRIRLLLVDAGDRHRHADDPLRHGRCRRGRRHRGPHHQQRDAGVGSCG